MAIIKDNKRGTYYISYKAKTSDGWKTVNIRNSEWKCTGDLKVTLRWMKSIEESEIEKDRKRRGCYASGNAQKLPMLCDIKVSFLSAMASAGAKPGTLYKYEHDLANYVLGPLGPDSTAAGALTPRGMDAVMKKMSDNGLSPDSMNGKMATIRKFISYARSRKFMDREQADECIDALQPVKSVSKERKENFFSNGDEDVEAFFATFESEDCDWLVPIETLFYGAFRIGEFLGITTDCVMPESNAIKVCKQVLANSEVENSTKTGKDRIVRLPEKIMRDIVSYMDSHCVNDGDFVFSMKKGKPLSRMTVRRIVDKHLEMAGLRHITLHGLRHSMATRMFDRGYDVREVQEQLGHSSMETTMEFYIHYTNSKRKKDLDDLL